MNECHQCTTCPREWREAVTDKYRGMIECPQCVTCPLATVYRSLPAAGINPPEPGGFECGITGEIISEGDEPLEGQCDYLTGWMAHQPHPLDAALARKSDAGDVRAAMWLHDNVPPAVLEAAVRMLKYSFNFLS